MSNSQFCIQQRQKEQQQLKKLLIFGFASSTVLHGILAYALPRWSFESPQAAKPIEMIIVDKPKPEPKPIVKPYAERYPLRKPTSVESPPVQAPTPPPSVKPSEPLQTQTPPPKPLPKTPEPTPKQVLATPTPAPKQPKVSAPVKKNPQLPSPSNVKVPNSSSATSTKNSSPNAPSSVVATNSAPTRLETSSEPAEGISCIDNCEPEYPSALNGVEGSAGIKLTIDRNGNVIGAELVTTDSNSQVNRQALLAARQMQFSSPGDSAASVQVKINFTVEGSEYDRARREEQERREQAKKEREEAEQQAQQEQLEREQARQQQQQTSTPPPVPKADPSPKLLPISPEELDEERLRKFKERIENYQEE